MSDARVAVDPIFTAFGVPATITWRPPNDDTALVTTVVWHSWMTEDAIPGGSVQRREVKRVMAIRLDEVPPLPRGSLCEAAEEAGGAVKRWRVDGLERLESDLARYIVVFDPDPNTVAPEL